MSKRTELEVIQDILDILITSGNSRRSFLLNHANINYVRGSQILRLMEKFGWINVEK